MTPRSQRRLDLTSMDDRDLLEEGTSLCPDNRFIASVFDFFSQRGYISEKQKDAVINTIITEEYR